MHAVMQSFPKGISVHYLSGRGFEKNAYKVISKVQHILTQCNLHITSNIAVHVLFLCLYRACIMGSWCVPGALTNHQNTNN